MKESLKKSVELIKEGINVAAIDLGNSLVQAVVNGEYYEFPNSIALCPTDVRYYDESNVSFEDNMVVEVDSGALHNKREKYFVFMSATERPNHENTAKNNIKARSDRSILISLSVLAQAAVKNSTDNSIDVEYEVVGTGLPTRQVKSDREELTKRLTGHHTVVFHYVPGRGEVTVNIQIKNVIVGTEGHLAYLALTRDIETLKVKDASLNDETILISDLGGGSLDHVGIRQGNLVDEIEGESFGINEYLDNIRAAIEDGTGFETPSRYILERRLALGPSHWKVVVDQEKKDIKPYIDPHLTNLSRRYLDSIDKIRRHVKMQEATRFYCIGNAVDVIRPYIESENKTRQKPMALTFPENLGMLNLIGIWFLVILKANR